MSDSDASLLRVISEGASLGALFANVLLWLILTVAILHGTFALVAVAIALRKQELKNDFETRLLEKGYFDWITKATFSRRPNLKALCLSLVSNASTTNNRHQQVSSTTNDQMNNQSSSMMMKSTTMYRDADENDEEDITNADFQKEAALTKMKQQNLSASAALLRKQKIQLQKDQHFVQTLQQRPTMNRRPHPYRDMMDQMAEQNASLQNQYKLWMARMYRRIKREMIISSSSSHQQRQQLNMKNNRGSLTRKSAMDNLNNGVLAGSGGGSNFIDMLMMMSGKSGGISYDDGDEEMRNISGNQNTNEQQRDNGRRNRRNKIGNNNNNNMSGAHNDDENNNDRVGDDASDDDGESKIKDNGSSSSDKSGSSSDDDSDSSDDDSNPDQKFNEMMRAFSTDEMENIIQGYHDHHFGSLSSTSSFHGQPQTGNNIINHFNDSPTGSDKNKNNNVSFHHHYHQYHHRPNKGIGDDNFYSSAAASSRLNSDNFMATSSIPVSSSRQHSTSPEGFINFYNSSAAASVSGDHHHYHNKDSYFSQENLPQAASPMYDVEYSYLGVGSNPSSANPSGPFSPSSQLQQQQQQQNSSSVANMKGTDGIPSAKSNKQQQNTTATSSSTAMDSDLEFMNRLLAQALGINPQNPISLTLQQQRLPSHPQHRADPRLSSFLSLNDVAQHSLSAFYTPPPSLGSTSTPNRLEQLLKTAWWPIVAVTVYALIGVAYSFFRVFMIALGISAVHFVLGTGINTVELVVYVSSLTIFILVSTVGRVTAMYGL